jgi:hypothetical protein
VPPHDLRQWRKQLLLLLKAREAEADVRFHLLQAQQKKHKTH